MRLILCVVLAFGLTLPMAAQSQSEMNRQAEQDFKAADAELNRVWAELKPRLPVHLRDKLVDSQLKWIQFRDAEAEARAAEVEGGSLRPLVYFGSLTETTRLRTQQLRSWLESWR